MKRLFLLCALFSILAVGCEELLPNEQKPAEKPVEQPKEDQTFFTDAEGNYIVSADGGEVMVVVATNLEYSIVISEGAEEWLSVADTRAEERIDKRTFIVARNDSFEERSAAAELIATDGKVLQTITFVQSGQPKVFETDGEGNYRIVANGGEVNVAVTTNLEYSVVISEDTEEWLSVADTRVVVREDKLIFVVAVNESFEERSATAELVNSAGEVLQTITFIQDGQSEVFDSNGKDSYTINAVGGEVEVIVTTNLEYNVNIPEEAQSWLSVADTRALAREETLIFIVAENDTFDERSASVELVNSEGEVLQTITFVQSGQPKVFETDSEDRYTIKAAGGEVSVAVTTNLEYSVVISEDAEEWLSLADTRAVIREETLTFIVAENKAYDRRSTTVTLVDNEGNVLQAIEFIQRAAVMPQFACPSDEIWYTNDSTTEPTKPYKTNVFGANIVSNTYSEDSERWVIKFDGDVTTIGNYAFYNCSSLTSIIIPDSITTIGNYAFEYCNSLESVTIPDSVTSIGTYAFYYCECLTNVYISDLSAWCKIDFGNEYANPLSHSANLYLNNKLVTELVIPSDIAEIKSDAFAGCRNLTSVTIPDSVTTIGKYAFCGCYKLTSVTIGDSVTTIESYAFYDCSSLTSVTIPDSVTTIGGGAFGSYSSLTSVYITDLSAWCKIDFGSESANPLRNQANLYLNNKLVTELVIPSDITEIKSYTFHGCGSLINVTIPDSVTTIGDYAFSGCYKLTSVTIGDSVTTIESYAFYGCHRLISVTIGNSVTTIEDYAFSGCSGLTSLTIPDSVTTIGYEAFSGCSSLISLTIGNGVTSIGEWAFTWCSSLTSVTIPDSVTTIGTAAFTYCSNLTKFNSKFASEDGRCLIVDGTLNSFAPAGLTEYTIPDSVTTIGDYAFSGCSSLTSITIPDSVTTIGNYAFRSCSGLTSVTIPDSVTTIGASAFAYCINLISIYCKSTTPPTVVLEYSDWYGYLWSAFDDNAYDRKIYVPMESVDAYKTTAYWADYMYDIVGYEF